MDASKYLATYRPPDKAAKDRSPCAQIVEMGAFSCSFLGGMLIIPNHSCQIYDVQHAVCSVHRSDVQYTQNLACEVT